MPWDECVVVGRRRDGNPARRARRTGRSQVQILPPLPSLTWAFAQVSAYGDWSRCFVRIVEEVRFELSEEVRFQNESPAQSDAGLDVYDDRVRSISH
jgi:hypothetical protein